jgi:phosphoribosylformylglycinamidine synthase
MMAALKEIIPGAQHWPTFTYNRSAQFEARFAMVEVQDSPSILLKGMAGSRMPIATAHGEGFACFESKQDMENANISLRFVDNRGKITQTHPLNPNGSPAGITGLTTPDGRFTVVMPHPERVFRTIQMSWAPDGAGEDSPWMQLFYNARKWVG